MIAVQELVIVECAWCTPPQAGDPDATHGVCEVHDMQMRTQSAQRQFDKVPSYVGERAKFEAYKERRRK